MRRPAWMTPPAPTAFNAVLGFDYAVLGFGVDTWVFWLVAMPMAIATGWNAAGQVSRQ